MTLLLRLVAWAAFLIGIVIAAYSLTTPVTTSIALAVELVTAAAYLIGGLVTWAILTVCAEVLDFFAERRPKTEKKPLVPKAPYDV